MKIILIIDKDTRKVASNYANNGPQQQLFGGPWGNPDLFLHTEMPAGFDPECLVVALDYSITEDAAKKAAKAQQAVILQTEAIVQRAMDFGQKLIKQFAAENLRMGITQAGKTAEVRTKMGDVMNALISGSLYDAIDQANAITDFDSTFVTEARIQGFIAQIQAYLTPSS